MQNDIFIYEAKQTFMCKMDKNRTYLKFIQPGRSNDHNLVNIWILYKTKSEPGRPVIEGPPDGVWLPISLKSIFVCLFINGSFDIEEIINIMKFP